MSISTTEPSTADAALLLVVRDVTVQALAEATQADARELATLAREARKA